MARPLSNDLRERVVARVAAGETVRSVATLFGVSVSSVVKWSQRWRATGRAEARPMGGKRRDAMAPGRDYALARLGEQPSLPLRQLRAELAARGVKVSYGALWNFVHAEGLSFKKRPSSQPRPNGPTSPAAAPVGDVTSTGSTRVGSSSSMKRG
jgi:transposase